MGDAGEVALIIVAVAEGQAGGEAGKALVPAVISGEEHVALAEAALLDRLAEHPQQDRSVDPVRRAQRIGRDRLDLVAERARLADMGRARLGRQVVDPVIIVAHAKRGRLRRIFAQQPLVVRVHDAVEIVGRRRISGRGRGEQRRCEKGHAHIGLPLFSPP